MRDDVAGLRGHVGAAADGDADVGPGQGRGVVDAVADHRDCVRRAPAVAARPGPLFFRRRLAEGLRTVMLPLQPGHSI